MAQWNTLLLAVFLAFNVSLHVRAIDCGGNERLYTSLTQGCSTAKAFCSDILSGSTPFPVRTYKYVTTYVSPSDTFTRRVDASTSFKTKTKNIVVTTRVITQIKGQATKTVTGCSPTETCGAFKGPGNGDLRDACTCVHGRKTITTRTYTRTYDQPTVTVYNRTITTYATIDKQRHTISTFIRKVPTVTSYICSTASPPAQGCGNRGHEWALFGLTQTDRRRPVYKWDIKHYKGKKPNQNGTATIIGAIFQDYYFDGPDNFANDIILNSCSGLYLNDRAYLYAPQTGVYVFSIPAYSQAAYMWIGQKAVTGYNLSNADLDATATNNAYGGGPSVLIRLKRGTYYPLRFAWRCISSSLDFYIQIISPDGHIMHGQYAPDLRYDPDMSSFRNDEYVNIFSPYIVRHGCGADAALAPPYPDWGHERNLKF